MKLFNKRISFSKILCKKCNPQCAETTSLCADGKIFQNISLSWSTICNVFLLGAMLIYLFILLRHHGLWAINEIFYFSPQVRMRFNHALLLSLLYNGILFYGVFLFNRIAKKWPEYLYVLTVFSLGTAFIFAYAFSLEIHHIWDFASYQKGAKTLLDNGIARSFDASGAYQTIFLRRSLVYIYPFYKLFGFSDTTLRWANSILTVLSILNFYFIFKLSFTNRYIPRFALAFMFIVYHFQSLATVMHNISGLFYLSLFILSEMWLLKRLSDGKKKWQFFLIIPSVFISTVLYDVSRSGLSVISCSVLLAFSPYAVKMLCNLCRNRHIMSGKKKTAVILAIVIFPLCGVLFPYYGYQKLKDSLPSVFQHKKHMPSELANIFCFTEFDSNFAWQERVLNRTTIKAFTGNHISDMSIGHIMSFSHYHTSEFIRKLDNKLNIVADLYGINFLQRNPPKHGIAKFMLKNKNAMMFCYALVSFFAFFGCIAWNKRVKKTGFGALVLLSCAIVLTFSMSIMMEVYLYYNFILIPLIALCCAIFFGEKLLDGKITEAEAKQGKNATFWLFGAIICIISMICFGPNILHSAPLFKHRLYKPLHHPVTLQVKTADNTVSKIEPGKIMRKYLFVLDVDKPQTLPRTYDAEWEVKCALGNNKLNMVIYFPGKLIKQKKAALDFYFDGEKLPPPKFMANGFVYDGIPVVHTTDTKARLKAKLTVTNNDPALKNISIGYIQLIPAEQ